MSKVKKFNFSLTDNTTFEGKDSLEFFSKALLDSGSRKTFRVIPGVKSKIKVPRYDAGDVIKDAGCEWNPSGAGALSQKSMEVCSKDIQIELCETTFENNFLSEVLRNGHNTGQVAPADFLNYMLGRVSAKVENDLEIATWQGDVDSETYPFSICDGILVIADGDDDVIKPTPAATITQSNVIAELSKVYNDIPQTISNDEDLTMYLSSDVYKMYLQALANASSEAFYNAKRDGVNFLGVNVIEAKGMPVATALASKSSNLVLLTDLMSDEEGLDVIPQRPISGARTIHVAGGFKFGVDYLVSEEVVMYNGTAA